jgi:hypothetical protein
MLLDTLPYNTLDYTMTSLPEERAPTQAHMPPRSIHHTHFLIQRKNGKTSANLRATPYFLWRLLL